MDVQVQVFTDHSEIRLILDFIAFHIIFNWNYIWAVIGHTTELDAQLRSYCMRLQIRKQFVSIEAVFFTFMSSLVQVQPTLRDLTCCPRAIRCRSEFVTCCAQTYVLAELTLGACYGGRHGRLVCSLGNMVVWPPPIWRSCDETNTEVMLTYSCCKWGRMDHGHPCWHGRMYK